MSLYKYIGKQLNYKKHCKLNKLIINCYCYPHIGNNIADNVIITVTINKNKNNN